MAANRNKAELKRREILKNEAYKKILASLPPIIREYPEVLECAKNCTDLFDACDLNSKACVGIEAQLSNCLNGCVKLIEHHPKDQEKGCALLRDGAIKVINSINESKIRILKLISKFEANGKLDALKDATSAIALISSVNHMGIKEKMKRLDECPGGSLPNFDTVIMHKLQKEYHDSLNAQGIFSSVHTDVTCQKRCFDPCQEALVLFKETIRPNDLFASARPMQNAL